MRAKKPDYYDILGVNRRASDQKLRQAYRDRLMVFHPDHNPGDVQACERTRQVVEAYKTLSNPRTRRSYDAALFSTEQLAIAPKPTSQDCSRIRQRTTVTILAAAVLTALLLAGLSLAGRDHVPVYTFNLSAKYLEPQPTDPALLVAPRIQDCREWYLAQEYQLAHPNRLIEQTAAKAFVDALLQAERSGNRKSAAFYRALLQEMRRAKNLGIPNSSPAEVGAKPPRGSS